MSRGDIKKFKEIVTSKPFKAIRNSYSSYVTSFDNDNATIKFLSDHLYKKKLSAVQKNLTKNFREPVYVHEPGFVTSSNILYYKQNCSGTDTSNLAVVSYTRLATTTKVTGYAVTLACGWYFAPTIAPKISAFLSYLNEINISAKEVEGLISAHMELQIKTNFEITVSADSNSIPTTSLMDWIYNTLIDDGLSPSDRFYLGYVLIEEVSNLCNIDRAAQSSGSIFSFF